MPKKSKIFIFTITLPVLLVLYNNCAGGLSGNKPVADAAGNLSENSANQQDLPQIENPSTGENTQPKGSALLAVGAMKSSMYSCDGGKTWKGYRTTDETTRCGRQPDDSYIDCSHHSDSPTGIAYDGNGTFITSFGWGRPGSVLRTQNAMDWELVYDPGTGYFAGVSFGNGTFYLHSGGGGFYSTDAGDTWNKSGNIKFNTWTPRKNFFIPGGGGRFVGTAGNGEIQDLFISEDNTLNFYRPENLPDLCSIGGVAIGNKRVLFLGKDVGCYSDDYGSSWKIFDSTELGLPPSVTLIFNGSHFRAYARGYFYETSENEFNWKRIDFNINDGAVSPTYLGHITYVPALKRFSAIKSWYENSRHYWSDDGINWTEIDPASGDAPALRHPMKQTAVGDLPACSKD